MMIYAASSRIVVNGLADEIRESARSVYAAFTTVTNVGGKYVQNEFV